MKANELRLGNYVKDDTGRIGQVLEFREGFVKLKMSHSILKIQSKSGEPELDIQPIPLTPDILEKAGFEKCEPDGWYKLKFKSGSCLDLFDGNPFHYADGNFSPDIPYVHTLQNIVYFLTGEELTINI